jgi:hypothetical protein
VRQSSGALDFFQKTNPRFYRGLLSAAPPALGQAGFESHANVMKMFEQVSSTMAVDHSLTGIFRFAKNCFTSPTESARSEFLGRGEWQAAFAVEKFLQPPVAGTALAPDDFRCDEIAHFATKPPAFQPVFPTDGAFNRDARDF